MLFTNSILLSRFANHARLVPKAILSRSLFVEVKETPNPDVQKFVPTPALEILPPEYGHTMVYCIVVLLI